jgi:hemerythrin-like domain-containing protein
MCDHCSCRTYAPIAELTSEHERILALAEPIADAIRRRREPDAATRDALTALLHRHVAKEEAGLYPLLLDAAGQPTDTYDELEAEHRELFTALDAGRFDHVALYALQRHIEEEEEVLFSAAVFHFDGDTWDDLDAAHRNVDTAFLTSRAGRQS